MNKFEVVKRIVRLMDYSDDIGKKVQKEMERVLTGLEK